MVGQPVPGYGSPVPGSAGGYGSTGGYGSSSGYGSTGYGSPGYGGAPGYGAGYPYGYAGYGGAPFAKPNNYLILAILSTVLCCWPIGIPAIVFASQVDSKWNRGDWQGAQDSSNKAKMWSFISIGIGAVAVIGYVALMLVAGTTSSRYGY